MFRLLKFLKEKIKKWLISIILLFFLRKKSRLTKMDKKKKSISIPDLHSDILDMFGYPISSSDCLCKRDKIIYVYGYMMVVKAVDDEPEILAKCIFDKEPAASFCLQYFNKHGKHVISDEVDQAALVVTADKSTKNKK